MWYIRTSVVHNNCANCENFDTNVQYFTFKCQKRINCIFLTFLTTKQLKKCLFSFVSECKYLDFQEKLYKQLCGRHFGNKMAAILFFLWLTFFLERAHIKVHSWKVWCLLTSLQDFADKWTKIPKLRARLNWMFQYKGKWVRYLKVSLLAMHHDSCYLYCL